MPPPPRLNRVLRRPPAGRVPWEVVWRVARWSYDHGRRMWDQNLSERERRELLALVRRGRRKGSGLSAHDRERVRALVRQLVLGGGAGRG